MLVIDTFSIENMLVVFFDSCLASFHLFCLVKVE